MAQKVITLDTMFTRTTNQVSVDAGEDVVVLNAKTGIYFSMEEIAINPSRPSAATKLN